MSTEHQITCINKSNQDAPHERIAYIGCSSADGRWRLTQQSAISGIESGKWRFFVDIKGRRVPVVVATSRYGRKYLKAEEDGVEPSKLLTLPECPG